MDTIMEYSCGKRELRQLLYKASVYIAGFQSEVDDVQLFNRCKPHEYFLELKKTVYIMGPSEHDGDPKSPINGHIKGIFLEADLKRGGISETSAFGDTCVSFPMGAIFTEETNLYFTDFYCTVSNSHYVTLVLTKAGSSVDDYCYSNLLKLDPFNNPFLWKGEDTFKIIKGDFLHVEIFYTENIDLVYLRKRFGSKKVFFKRIRTLEKGMRNLNCSECIPNRRTPTTSSLLENYLLID